MKTSIATLLMAFCITGCNAQGHKSENILQSNPDTIQPKISSKVTRRYDDKGNTIGYDSSYIWSYSNRNGKMQQVFVDSVMSRFRKQFDLSFPLLFNERFGVPIWNDSLFYKEFARPDYFMNKWRGQAFDMDKMMQEMDSMRNQFFDRNYPGLIEEDKK